MNKKEPEDFEQGRDIMGIHTDAAGHSTEWGQRVERALRH